MQPARTVLPHASDCDGLSIMVERLPGGKVKAIRHARDRSLAAGLNLLQWANEVRIVQLPCRHREEEATPAPGSSP